MLSYGMSNTDYHAHPAVSRSQLHKALVYSPAHALLPGVETPAMALGSAVHMAILEPTKFVESYYLMGAHDRRTSAGKVAAEQEAQEHADKIGLKSDAWEQCLAMADAVHVAYPMTGYSEVSVFWTDATGLDCRARIDMLTTDTIIDLKTTSDAREHEFAKSCWLYGYDMQVAFYLHGLAACGISERPWRFVVVEKTPPYAVSVFEPDELFNATGEHRVARALALWKQCMSTDTWPGYDATPRVVRLPTWATEAF